MHNRQDSFVNGVGLGLMFGAGAFVLMSTKKGQVWRKQLANAIAGVQQEMELEQARSRAATDASADATAQSVAVQSGVALPSVGAGASPKTPPQDQTLRGLLNTIFEAIKTDFNDLAEAPAKRAAQQAEESKKKRVKSHTFKNAKK